MAAMDDTQHWQPSQGVRPSATSIGSAPAAIVSPGSGSSSPPVDMSSATGRGGLSSTSSPSSLRSRKTKLGQTYHDDIDQNTSPSPSLVDGSGNSQQDDSSMPTLEPETATAHPKWVALALFSGAFAAMNGVFAKLTTSENTVSLSASIHHLIPFLDPDLLTVLLRASFFGLNIASNAIMWVLFTRALTSHPSTTKVSVVNTSANFTITAIMGSLVFGEAVGGVGGIVGLALLVGGCVVLGAEEKKDKEETAVETTDDVDAEAAEEFIDGRHLVTGDLVDLEDEVKSLTRAKPAAGILEGTESEEDLVDLGDIDED